MLISYIMSTPITEWSKVWVMARLRLGLKHTKFSLTKALTIRYPGGGGGGGGGVRVYRIEKNNRAQIFFEKNNCALIP